MKNNRLIKFLLNPPAVFLCFVWLVAILLIAGSVIIIAEEYKQWPSYVVFALSAVFLAYSVYGLVRFIPSAKTKIAQSALRHPFIGSILGNYGFRTISFAVASFAANVVFAFMNGPFIKLKNSAATMPRRSSCAKLQFTACAALSFWCSNLRWRRP